TAHLRENLVLLEKHVPDTKGTWEGAGRHTRRRRVDSWPRDGSSEREKSEAGKRKQGSTEGDGLPPGLCILSRSGPPVCCEQNEQSSATRCSGRSLLLRQCGWAMSVCAPA